MNRVRGCANRWAAECIYQQQNRCVIACSKVKWETLWGASISPNYSRDQFFKRGGSGGEDHRTEVFLRQVLHGERDPERKAAEIPLQWRRMITAEAVTEHPEKPLTELYRLLSISCSWDYEKTSFQQQASEDLKFRDHDGAYRSGVPWLPATVHCPGLWGHARAARRRMHTEGMMSMTEQCQLLGEVRGGLTWSNYHSPTPLGWISKS